MEKFSLIKRASILGILGNTFLFIIKIISGFIFKSQAMLADAFNSFSDIFSSLMTFIGNKIASKPSDEDHNLGHGKAEYIYSLFISIIMFILVFNIAKDAIYSLYTNQRLLFSWLLVGICILTIIVKLGLYLYTKMVFKQSDSLLIEANAIDHRNDCLLTLCNLIAILASLKKIYFLDGLVALGISLWIFISALKIFIASYDVLMDKSIDDETKNKVLELVKGYKEIKKINHFNSTPVGYRYQISLTIFVDGNLSTFASHEIANRLEKEIIASIKEIYLVVIHVNPI